MTTLKALSQDEKTRFFAKAREDAARMHFESHCVSREEGRKEGVLQGEAQALLRILSNRFGQVSNSIRAGIENVTIDQIRAWLDLALDAKTINDVFENNPAR